MSPTRAPSILSLPEAEMSEEDYNLVLTWHHVRQNVEDARKALASANRVFADVTRAIERRDREANS